MIRSDPKKYLLSLVTRQFPTLASDKHKPNGQFYIPPCPEKIRAFLAPLPVRAISGIGKVSEQMLKALGIASVQDLYDERVLLFQVPHHLGFSKVSKDLSRDAYFPIMLFSLLILGEQLFSNISSHFFLRASMGIGSGAAAFGESASHQRKSFSHERTFSALSDLGKIISKAESLSQAVAKELAAAKMVNWSKVFGTYIIGGDKTLLRPNPAHCLDVQMRDSEAENDRVCNDNAGTLSSHVYFQLGRHFSYRSRDHREGSNEGRVA